MRLSRPRTVGYVATLAALVAATGVSSAAGTDTSTSITEVVFKPAATISVDGSKDLDGDGRADSVEVAYHYTTGTSRFDHLTIRVRRGTDGHVVWTRTVADSPTLNAYVVARIGSPPRPGLIVTNNTVRAYDGRTGTQLWLKNSLANGIVLPVSHGRAANVLIRDTLGRSVVVAGADGSEHVVTAPQSLFSTQVALGDVDRDGNADFAIFTSPWNCDACSRSKLDAYSTATGRTLWSRVWRGPGLDSVTPIVDATGDGSADLIVRFTEPSYFEHSDVLVNGATGASPFTVPWRTYLFAVGDVNGDRHTDLVWSYHDGRRYPFEARSGVTGAVLWRAPFIPSSDPESDVLGPIGDVNADGVQEVGHGTAYGWVEPVEAFLDGRTGAATSEYRGTPLRASIDATGDDFADVVATGQQSWSVVATEGRTGSRLYAVPTPGFDYAPLTASDVTGDGKAEVFGYFIPAHRTGPDGTLLVIDGATHQVRWSAKP